MINGVSSISDYQSYYDFGVKKKNSSAGEDDFSQKGKVNSTEENSEKKNFPVEKKDKNNAGKELTEPQQKQLDQLKKRDQEVRQHEAAHQAAAGGLARGKSFTYQKGPDGQQYAVGGEVQIDTSAGKTPQETIAKMTTIQRAALAPADPSGQDQKVASQAAQTKAEAQQELAEKSKPASEEKDFSVEENSAVKKNFSSENVKENSLGRNSKEYSSKEKISSEKKDVASTIEEIQKKNSERKASSYEQISPTLKNSSRLKSVYTQSSGVAPLKCSMCQGTGCYHAG